MNNQLKGLLDEAERLPVADRALLAERLIASLEDEDVEQIWGQEAERREAEIRSGKAKAVPSELVYRRIDAMLRK
jgi:putative addiction module component (TIGR02574 family)